MATIRSKGTSLSITMASVLTPIAQMITLDFGDIEDETFEDDTLDNSSPGIPYANSGRVEGGKVSGDLFLDPNNASQAALIALISAPAAAPVASTIVFNNSPVTTMSFHSVGHKLGGSAALKEGVKGKFACKIADLPVFTHA